MGEAVRIETMEWRVCRDGCSTFQSEALARDHAERLKAQEDMKHLGPVRIQWRKVTVVASNWVTE